MPVVWSEQRITPSGPNCSQGLGGKCCGVEKVRQALVALPRISDLVGTILSAAILWGCTIIEAVLFAVALDGIVDATASVNDRERFSTLPGSNRIDLPSGERRLFEAGKVLAILQFIVQRESKAVLDVVLRNAVLDLPNPGWIGVAPALVATLL